MEIQVDDAGLARWQCEICDAVMTWRFYRQLPPPSTRGSSERSSMEPQEGDEGDGQQHAEQPS
eukprot:8725817-Heterocapsa_arctica.AAC.1